MNEQYFLLRKENDLLNSLIGQSLNQKSKFEAEKILNEIHLKAQSRLIGKKALCYVTDKNEIKGVGGSTLLQDPKTGQIVSNVILDQFGIFLAGIFKRRTGGANTVSIKDITNASQTLNIWNSSATFCLASPVSGVGYEVQVGSGTTVPARTDFNIETAFGTSPESLKFSAVSNPVWNSGQGSFKYAATISAGGSGTINETIQLALKATAAVGIKTFAVFRDSISPGVAFVASDTITVEYTIQM